MKRKLILVISVMLVMVFIVGYNIYPPQPQTYTYTLSPKICGACFNISAEDFCSTQARGSYMENGFESANLDQDGNLILVVTEEQKNAWTVNANTYVKYMKDFEFSDDYSKLVVEFYKDDITALIVAVPYCIEMQVLAGKNSQDIKVECIVIGENEDDIISHTVFPDDPVIFDWSIVENHTE